MLYQVLDLFQNRFLKGMVPIVEADLSKTIRWFHVVELSESLEELSNEVKSGDLLIVMGGGRKKFQITYELVKIGVKNDCSAILFYAGAIPEKERGKIISYAKAKRFTLFEIQGKNPPISSTTATIMRGITEKNHTDPIAMGRGMVMDILHNDFYGNPELFIAHASAAGYDLRETLCAMVIEPIYRKKTQGKGKKEDSLEKYREFASAYVPAYANRILSRYFRKPCLAAAIDNKYIVFLPESGEKTARQIGEEILALLCHKADGSVGGIRIAIGMAGKELDEFYQSTRQAEQILEIMQMQNTVNKVRDVDDYFLSLLLKKYQEEPLFRHLYNTTIQPLLDYDKAEKYSLLDSLEMYFDCDQNISKAADVMYMHRNTMKSRLEKIQELIGRDLEDSFDCLELQIALHYHKLNNYSKKKKKN